MASASPPSRVESGSRSGYALPSGEGLAFGRGVSAFGNRLLPFYVGVTVLLPGRWVAGSEDWVLRNKFGGPSWEQTDRLQGGAPAGRPFCGVSGTAAPTLGLFTWGVPVLAAGEWAAPLPWQRCWPVVWPGAWARAGSPGGEPGGFPQGTAPCGGLCGAVGLGDGPLVGDRAAALSMQPARLRPFPSLAAWQKLAGHMSVIPSEVWRERPVPLVSLPPSRLPLGSLTPSSFCSCHTSSSFRSSR